MQRPALYRLVDQLHDAAMLGLGLLGVAAGDGRLEAAEVGLDRRRVTPILAALALSAQDALVLGVDVGHTQRRRDWGRGGRVL